MPAKPCTLTWMPFSAPSKNNATPPCAARPSLWADGPKRGSVAFCSYAIQRFGIRSTMPMARAVKLCPNSALNWRSCAESQSVI